MESTVIDGWVEDAKAELDALEDAFAKMSPKNSGVVTAIRTGVRAGSPVAQPLYGVTVGGGGFPKPPKGPQPLYGVIVGPVRVA